MHIKGLYIDLDTLVYLGGILVLGIKYLLERQKLPAYIQKYLDAITQPRVEAWIRQAADIAEYDKTQRHEYVVSIIERYAEKVLNMKIPRSFVDIIVKFVYKKIQNTLGSE